MTVIPTFRNDAEAKVTGKTRFAADLKLPGMLHAVPVYPDCIHATLLGVESSEALALPGVVRVLTAADVPGHCRFGQIERHTRILADDRIRCEGDVVALVVARTRAEAERAASHVKVLSEPLPVLLDPEKALDPDATLVHPELATNLAVEHRVRRGDPAVAFPACDEVLEAEFTTPRIEHAYLEPEAAVCIPREDGVMEVRAGMQHPFSTRRFVAAFLGVSLSEVEVVGLPVGGGFGGKDDTIAMVCARAALAARLTGRPVSMVYRREWSLKESYKRHPYRLRYKVGFDRDGALQAMEADILADAGAYLSVSPWVTWRSTVQCCGPYGVEHVKCDTRAVYTNQVFTGAMRGFGSPQVNFAVEQLVEMAAERLGMDAVEFRRRNMLRQGDRTITGQVLQDHRVSLEQVLDEVVARIGYHDRLPLCTFGKGDELYGIGLALSYRGMSLGAEGVDFCSADVLVQPDGSVLLETGVHENGQGSESAMILILARELGLDPSGIRYRRASTSTIPDSGTTVASRGTLMGGGAVVDAAAGIRRQLSSVAAPLLGCSPEDVSFRGGHLHSPHGAYVSFREAVQRAYAGQVHPRALGTFRAPRTTWDEHTGQGDAYFTWVYACQGVELKVDRRTGRVKLLRAVAAHDVGRAVNPGMLLGQFYGGMAMGTGYALHEELKLEDGRVRTLNFDSYRFPRTTDLPDFEGVVVENPDPLSPSGAKGVGEPTNELMAPAIANALYRATGRRFFSLPMRVPPES